jgi:hypothetical protein
MEEGRESRTYESPSTASKPPLLLIDGKVAMFVGLPRWAEDLPDAGGIREPRGGMAWAVSESIRYQRRYRYTARCNSDGGKGLQGLRVRLKEGAPTVAASPGAPGRHFLPLPTSAPVTESATPLHSLHSQRPLVLTSSLSTSNSCHGQRSIHCCR